MLTLGRTLFCVFVSQRLLSCLEICTYFFHKFVHRAASVIAGDVVMQISPDTLDVIMVRAVRRQKMQADFVAQGRQGNACAVAAMNRIVVQDDMDCCPCDPIQPK
jgi:hypothetical protein